MNIKVPFACSLTRARIAVTSAMLVALVTAAAPGLADEPAANPAVSRVTDVPLADLTLSTPEGMNEARQRLHAMAQRVCADRAGGPPSAVSACVDNTMATALRQITALRQTMVAPRNSVTRAANVSLADLDLSTLEGSLAAHERLEAMARRLCRELLRSPELTNQLNYASCVHDTLAGAWAQANGIRIARDMRTARRAAH